MLRKIKKREDQMSTLSYFTLISQRKNARKLKGTQENSGELKGTPENSRELKRNHLKSFELGGTPRN